MNDDKSEIGPSYGPFRKAPEYYVGETCGTIRGKGSYGRGSERRNGKSNPILVRHPRFINHDDVERYPNGAIAGKRDKLARRRIRKLIMQRGSAIEGHIRRARQLNSTISNNADNPREFRRMLKKTLSFHQPLPDVDSRALRTEFRERKRALAKERGCHVRELEADIVKQLADKVYGTEETKS